jgi:hypothetical protein
MTSGGCGWDFPENDQILVPTANGYEIFTLLQLFGYSERKLSAVSGLGMAPLHYITQRGPFQDGENVLDMRWDTRTVQMLIEEALGGQSEYWDRHFDLTDLLRPNRAFPAATGVVRPLIYRKWLTGGKEQHITDLETIVGSPVVTSHDARFVHWGLRVGDGFTIDTGADAGAYTVVAVENDYSIELSANMAATATGVQAHYQRGWGIRDLYFMLELGPTFDEDSLAARYIPTGYREALRFVAHDPFWYGEEQSETWRIATALGNLVFDGEGAWLGAFPGVGRWLFASTFVGETIALVYWGTKEAKPLIEIDGPAENPTVSNMTIGATLMLDYDVVVGETVTVDTLALTVTNNLGTNLLPYLTGDLAQFGIWPDPQAPNRQNEVYVSFSGGVAGQSAARLYWKNRYVALS